MIALLRCCNVRPKLNAICARQFVADTRDDQNDEKDVKATLPDEPTTCCMSGCPNCVWIEYAEKLSEYYRDGGERAIKKINESVSDPNIKAFILLQLRMRRKEG